MDETNLRLRVDYVPSATIEPVITVRESDTLERAVTLMRLHNFSQLPVMRGKGKRPKGVVSWRSIGRALLKNGSAELKDCIDHSVAKVGLDDDLLEIIGRINQDDHVLVVKENGDISGIVTSADLGDALAAIARPYLLVSQCENAMRQFIRRCIDLAIIDEADVNEATLSRERPFAGVVDDLPFGDLINILSLSVLWSASSFRTDPVALRADLSRAGKLRNEIMHFRDHTPETEALRERLPNVIAEIQSVIEGLPAHA